jgi:hypothetical protein
MKVKYKLEFDADVNQNYRSLITLHTRTNELTSKLTKLIETRNELLIKVNLIDTDIIHVQNVLTDPSSFETGDFPPCPNRGCHGLLDSNDCCALCATTCYKCRMPNDDNHVCTEDALKTVAFINQSCKPCPVCRVNVYKGGGCDDMWCTRCKHAYSWRTGQLLTITPRYHNPHFADESEIEGLWNVIRDVTVGKLRARLKTSHCDPVYIGIVLHVLNNIIEFRFEHMRYEARIDQSRKKYQELQLASIISDVSDVKLQKDVRRVRTSIEKDELILQAIQEYVETNGPNMILLYNGLLSDKFDIHTYCEYFQSQTARFVESGIRYHKYTGCRFPYIINQLRVERN